MLTKVSLLLLMLCVAFAVYAKCPRNTVEVRAYNTSPNVLKLETKSEYTCRRRNIAYIKPGVKGKYCINHNYVLKVTTLALKGDTRLAISATDLWSPLVITTPEYKRPDVQFEHQRGKRKVTTRQHGLLKSEESSIEESASPPNKRRVLKKQNDRADP